MRIMSSCNNGKITIKFGGTEYLSLEELKLKARENEIVKRFNNEHRNPDFGNDFILKVRKKLGYKWR